MAWHMTDGNHKDKSKSIMYTLRDWGKKEYGNIKQRTKETWEILRKARQLPYHENNYNTVILVEKAHDSILKIEELWWSQRIKCYWLTEGVTIPNFFIKNYVKEVK